MEILGDGMLVTFNDPIHGTIQLHWLLGKIIETPEFQRLHYIKQLSSTFHVYPEANHTRFGHSIGTAYLAGKLVRHLKSSQTELEISDEDVLCVEIAGLCHDLGHGPYSHLFDDQLLPMIGVSNWKHEKSSCRMIDRIKETLGKQYPRIAAFLNEERCAFIKEMIDPSGEGEYQGLNNDKHFRKNQKRARERAIVYDFERKLPDDLHGKIRVTIANFNYGRGRRDPVAEVWFYEEDAQDEAVRVTRSDVSRLLPSVFEENIVQVFYTDKAPITQNVKDVFREWNP